MTRLPTAVPKPRKSRKKPRTPIRRSRVRQKAGKPNRFAKRRDPEYLEWIRTQPCMMRRGHDCDGNVEACHIKSRGAGGFDRDNTLPLCHGIHMYQHQIGIKSWAELFHPLGLDGMRHMARAYTERYDRERSVG